MIEPGKLPLLLVTVTFVVTFVATRMIVRAIRAGKGPFTDNTVGGVHVHHVVPGIVLVVLGGLVAFGAQSEGWRAAAAVAFGIGLALVLDEFALDLAPRGRLLGAGGTALGRRRVRPGGRARPVARRGFARSGSTSSPTRRSRVGWGRWWGSPSPSGALAIAVLKGKFASAVIGALFPLVAIVAAVRLARPRSVWATRRYAVASPKQMSAQRREQRFHRRWRSKVVRCRTQWPARVSPGTDVTAGSASVSYPLRRVGTCSPIGGDRGRRGRQGIGAGPEGGRPRGDGAPQPVPGCGRRRWADLDVVALEQAKRRHPAARVRPVVVIVPPRGVERPDGFGPGEDQGA